MDHHRSTMCHLEGAFPHDLRWFSAYAAKWFGVSSDNEIEIINDSNRESVNHVNFFRNKIFLRIEISSGGKEKNACAISLRNGWTAETALARLER